MKESLFIFIGILTSIPAMAVNIDLNDAFNTSSAVTSLLNAQTNQNAGSHFAPAVENDCTDDELESLNAVAGYYSTIGHGDDSEVCIPTKCKTGYTLVDDAGKDGDTTACMKIEQIDTAALDADMAALESQLDKQLKKTQKQSDKKQQQITRQIERENTHAEKASANAVLNDLQSKRCANAGGKWDAKKNKCECPSDGCKCESGQKWNNKDVLCENDDDKSRKQERCEELKGTWNKNAGTCNEVTCPDGKLYDAKQIKCVDKLEKPHSKEELEELQGKVDAAKEKEQSFANRMLSGATMAATGAGGQMLASALAEQNADADAERDMAAYLATFRCNWGSNSVPGGEQNVALAGGNELISLYQEYVALANDLKIRKSALDMAAGIESEAILDGATSGLYDDVGTGITSGAYASLARALMDPSGVDAQKWAAQKEETQKQLKTGAITAGVGAVVGLVGNVLINHVNYNKKKRKDDPAVKAKYKEVTDKTKQLEQEVNATPVSAVNSDETCEKYLAIGTWPYCDCVDENETFSSDKKACVDTSSDDTETPAENKCNLTGKHKSDTCECVDNATLVDNNECVCKPGYDDPEGKNVCTPVSKEEEQAEKEAETKTVVVETHLSSDILFKTGSAELTQTAKKYIFDFTYLIEQYPHLLNKESFKKDENDNAKATIIIYGHTDRVPFKAGSNMTNEKLSEQRAEAIQKQLAKESSLFKEIANDIHVIGKGAAECTQQLHPKANDPQCRKVHIEISVSSDDTEGLGNLRSAFQGFSIGNRQATGTGARFEQK